MKKALKFLAFGAILIGAGEMAVPERADASVGICTAFRCGGGDSFCVSATTIVRDVGEVEFTCYRR